MTLHLTINTGVHSDTTASACGTFTWENQVYTASGDYDYIVSNGSCQTVTLHLTINTWCTQRYYGHSLRYVHMG